MKKHKVGCVPDGRIAIRDLNGAIRGHVGSHATEATVTRFGVRNPKLVNRKGALEWHGQKGGATRRPAADRKHSLGSVKS